MSSGDSSTFFFPLRTNVEYFVSTEGFLALEQRIKQAAILYDVIIFEGGVYTASVGPTGSMDFWIPPDQVTEEELRLKIEPYGGHHHLAIAPTGSSQFQTLVSGPVERRFRSEFYSILKNLGSECPKWVKMETYDLTPEAKNLVNRISQSDERNLDIEIGKENRFLKSKILNNLNRDLILTWGLGWAASIDPLYTPILRKKMTLHGGLQAASGFLALDFIVPDFSRLPWEIIFELREHKAMAEFRRRMINIENLVRASLPNVNEAELRYQISQVVTDELLKEIESLQPTTRDIAINLTLNFVGGLAPLPWSTIPSVVSGIQQLTKSIQTQNSWIAVFMKLRASDRRN